VLLHTSITPQHCLDGEGGTGQGVLCVTRPRQLQLDLPRPASGRDVGEPISKLVRGSYAERFLE